MKKGFLFINLGTPASTKVSDVKSYLRTFLMDPYVIDIPWPLRFLLVNGVIVPFRAKKSAEAYEKIWSHQGSPLMIYSEEFVSECRKKLNPNEWHAELAMRYGEPSIESAILKMKAEGVQNIYAFSAYPQYAMSTTKSVEEELIRVKNKLGSQLKINFISSYENHPDMVKVWVQLIRKYENEFQPDLTLFSYHGLPVRHVKKIDSRCQGQGDCSKMLTTWNRLCYRRQCFATTEAITKALGWTAKKWKIAFQSRLDKNWIKPFSDDYYRDLPKQGVKKLLVVCPSFTTDCLETLEEVGLRAKEEFCRNGGSDLKLVPCLNAHPEWIHATINILNTPYLWTEI